MTGFKLRCVAQTCIVFNKVFTANRANRALLRLGFDNIRNTLNVHSDRGKAGLALDVNKALHGKLEEVL